MTEQEQVKVITITPDFVKRLKGIRNSIRFLVNTNTGTFAEGYAHCLSWMISLLTGRTSLDGLEDFSNIASKDQNQSLEQ